MKLCLGGGCGFWGTVDVGGGGWLGDLGDNICLLKFVCKDICREKE